MRFNALLEPQSEGGYTAYIPSLPGCVSEGETQAIAKMNLRDALQGYLVVANWRARSTAKANGGKIISL